MSTNRTQGSSALRGIGPTFPVSPVTDTLHFHTTHGYEFKWDGTRWLTTQEFLLTGKWQGTLGGTGSVGGFLAQYPLPNDFSVYLTRHILQTYANGPNDGSNYWTYVLQIYSSGLAATTTLRTVTTAAHAAGSMTDQQTNLNVVVTNDANNKFIQSYPSAKTGAPGTFQVNESIRYRLIGT